MAEELRVEPRTQGALVRLLGAEGGGRSALTAFAAGVVGAVACVASLLQDWMRVQTAERVDGRVIGRTEYAIQVGASNYTVVYLLGVLALLALLGSVIARPDLAARLRLGATGLGAGIVGVLVAIVFQLRDVTRLAGFYGYPAFIRPITDDAREPEGTVTIVSTEHAYQPGMFLAFGAVVALVAGVWLAARAAPAAGPVTGVAAMPGVIGGYVLMPVPVAASGDGVGAPGVSSFPVGVPALATPVSGAPVAPVPVSPAPTSPGPGARSATSEPEGPPGLPPDRAGTVSSFPSGRVGYADGLTVTRSDPIDPGTRPDILRN